jgi:uncharacterized protein DUF6644
VSPLAFFEWLAQTRASVAMAQSVWAFPIVESIHVLALCLFLGMATILDFRLLGLVMRDLPVSEVVTRLLPWTAAGFAVMVISGVLTFLNAPVRYYENIFFRIKLVALLLAGLNVWVFHSGIWLKVSDWDLDAVAPFRARLAGVLSLVLWACIVVAGRMIAYNWFDKVAK